MSSTKHKLRIAGALAFLATLALTISCTGFFVNPTVSTITIDPPNPSVSVGFTTSLTAAGTDSNGNALTLTGGTSCTGTTVCWSSSDTSVATISTGGALKGISAGTATITAASGTASATTTATVTLSNVTNIILNSEGGGAATSFSLGEGAVASGTQCLTAIASAGGQSVDVTTSVTWQANPSTLVTLEQQTDPMCVTAGSTAGTATIYATYVSGSNVVTSNSITVTVTQ
ncbi:MAG: Ig-like domain-containing protein [Candidatus Sulfotelmatobacter sp.]